MKSEINVTPLVDVTLVLLIIFLAVTDEMAHGRTVTLPAAAAAEAAREERVISVANVGGHAQLWWDHARVADLAELRRRVTAEQLATPRRAYVQADADLPYGEVYPVLIAIREAGAPGLSLGTRSLQP